VLLVFYMYYNIITDWITDFSLFFLQFLVYFPSKVGKLKAIHTMCKRDTDSAKMAPESVLSNRGDLKGTHLTRFSPGGYLRGFISREVISVHLGSHNGKMCNH